MRFTDSTLMYLFLLRLQIVWDHTVTVGCAVSKCASGASVSVCEYGFSGECANVASQLGASLCLCACSFLGKCEIILQISHDRLFQVSVGIWLSGECTNKAF